MTITITQEHNEYRLLGTLQHLDAGAGNAKIRLYGGTRPGAASGAPSSAMLVEIPLTKPAGTIVNGQLVLTQQEDGLIANSGLATWARFITGSGGTAFDADVDDGANNGEVVMLSRQLFAGGDAKLVSAVLG